MKGHIRKRGNSWAIIIDLGRDSSGKRKQQWHSVKGTKRDAEKKKRELLTDLDTGQYVEPSKMTVTQYLDYWLNNHAKQNIAGKTFERYEQIIKNQVNPKLGGIPIQKLESTEIQEFYTYLSENGRMDGKGGLSPQTVKHVHRVLKVSFDRALKLRPPILKVNPINGVDIPRVQQKEMTALNENETALLLQASKKTRYYHPVLIAVTTGIRRGELCGLKWKDIDFKKGNLTINRSLEKTKNGLKLKSPKTERSRRTIKLSEITISAFKDIRIEQNKNRLLIGQRYKNNDLVFPQINGDLINPDVISTGFKSLVKKLDIPRVRFHDLRHSFATQQLKHGVSAKVVSQRLGHSSVAFTLDVYTHVLDDMQDEAASVMDFALRSAIEDIENGNRN